MMLKKHMKMINFREIFEENLTEQFIFSYCYKFGTTNFQEFLEILNVCKVLLERLVS